MPTKFLKLRVRSGGVNGFDKYGNPDPSHRHSIIRAGLPVGETKTAGQDKKVKEILTSTDYEIVTKNSLKGIVSRLMGEVLSIREIDSDLGGDSVRDDVVNSARFEVVKPPKVAMYSERYRSILAPSPTADLNGIHIKNCKGVTGFFHQCITAVTNSEDAQECYSAIYEAKELSVIENSKEKIQKLLNSFEMLNRSFEHKFFQLIIEKLKTALKSADLEVTKISVPALDVNNVSLSILEKVSEFCAGPKFKPDDLMKIKGGSFIPKTQKDWASEISYSTRGVGFALYTDFNIYVTVDQKAFSRFQKGPGVAGWAEGGVVEWEEVDEYDLPIHTLKEIKYSFATKEIVGLEKVKVVEGTTHYFEYAFHSSKPFSHASAHSLLTHLLGKGDSAEAGSISFDNDKALIRTQHRIASLKKEFSISYGNGQMSTRYKLIREEKKIVSVLSGSKFNFNILMCYAEKRDGRLHCPVLSDLVDEASLYRYFKTKGFNILALKNTSPLPSVLDMKVQLHNLFELTMGVEVENPELAARSIVDGIGQRKSYGFGQMRFEKA